MTENKRRIWVALIATAVVLAFFRLIGCPLAVSAAQGAAPATGAKPQDLLPRPSVYDSRWFPLDDEGRSQAQGMVAAAADRRFIYVHQNSQMMYVFEGGLIIRQIPMSSGLPAPRTVTKAWTGRVGKYWGTFLAYDVYADNAWFLFKDDGSILIHSAPYTLVDSAKAYQDLDLLGKEPGSHGCIRIHPDDAAWLTEWGPQGVLTVVTPLTASLDQ